MTRPRVIYSAHEDCSGFSRYVLRVYKPKEPRARALVERIRRDPSFPRHIHQRDTFDLVLRYRPTWPWAERRMGGEIWSRYAAWQRGQQNLAAGSGLRLNFRNGWIPAVRDRSVTGRIVPIAVVSNRSNMRSQIQLINQLIGAGEEHFSVQASPGRRRPRIVEKWKR